ncbi:MAG: amidohydrolase family protein [Actinomycetota bacterium]
MVNRNRLDQVVEPPIDPDLEIIDAHHHLWDTENRYGRYELEDLHTDTGAGHNVVATVFIDCGANYRVTGPEHLRPVGETEYVAGRASASDESTGAPIAAIVGHADLRLGAAVSEVLDAHVDAAGGRFRGIRHSGARSGEPAVASSRPAPADLYAMPSFRDGARALAAKGLSFEAWQYHHQLPDVADLAAAVPDLPIIVNHLGGPLGVGRYATRRVEVLEELQIGLSALADLPNTTLKLGGVGMTRFGTGWEHNTRPPDSDTVAAYWGDLIRWCIERFGPDRCMFESNYPVDGETTGYGVLWNAFKKITADHTMAERRLLFADTARRVYRL